MLRHSVRIVACMCALLITPGVFADEPWVWWQGEQPQATNFPESTWFDARPDERDLLSGGAWMTHMGEREAGSDAAFAQYQVQIPSTGKYNLWVRKMWKHGPFRWRFDDGTWQTCGRDIALADSVTLRTHVPANWVHLGAVDLDQGARQFELQLLAEPGEKLTAAFDCFVLMPAATPFFPNGKLKPGETSGNIAPGHFAYEPAADPFTDDAQLDLRRLNESTAGANGWVKRDGDRFILGTGEPVRFWAVNLGAQNAGQNRAAIDYMARRLAKLGVNMVRYHSPMFTAESGYQKLDDQKLDDLCYLIAALKKEGIYTTVSVYFPLWIDARQADTLEGYDGIQNNRPFSLVFFATPMQQLHRGWLRQLVETRNPYTGNRLSNEPALAAIELVNEDSVFFWTFNRENVPEVYWREMERRFGEWLGDKYGSIDAAQRAWGGAAHDRDDAEAGLAALYEIWHLTRDGLQHASDAKRQRLMDQARFLTRLQRNYYDDTTQMLKQELGYQGMVICSNWKAADPVTLDALERYTYTVGDVIDRHGYFGGEHDGEGSSYSVRTGHTFADRSGLRHPEALPVQVNQIAGYPHIISEINWPQPNRFRSEMTAIVSAYGSLQDIDGLYLFSLDNNYVRATGINKFQLASPEVAATFPAAALMYRQQLVQPAEPVVTQRLKLDDLYELKGEAVTEAQALDQLREADAQGNDAADGATPDAETYHPLSFYVGPVVRELDALSEDADNSAKPDTQFAGPVDERIIRSVTHELTWNHETGLLRINAARCRGAVGFLNQAGAIDLGDVTIESGNEYASILLVPLDGKPVAQSERLLVQAMTEDRPFGFKAENGRIQSLGGFPFNIRNIDATITLPPGDNTTRVTVLDANGYARDTRIDVQQREGRATFTLAADGIYHIIER